MAAVSCPSCDESVLLPVANLPDDSLVQCPWCGQTCPADDWMEKLPPLAIVFGADGRPLELASLQASASETPVHSQSDDDVPTDGRGFLEVAADPIVTESADFPAGSLVEQLEDASASHETAEEGGTVALVQSDDSDDSDSQPGMTLAGLTLDQLSSELSSEPSSEPSTIDAIEDAWDSHEPAADQIDEDDWQGDDGSRDKVRVGAGERQRVQGKVKFADDQRSLYQKRHWVRRPRSAVRLLKIAFPSLLALPVIIAILLISGLNLGFYPFDGSFGGHSTSVASRATDAGESNGDGSDTPTPQVNRPPVGRVLVDSDQNVGSSSSPSSSNSHADDATLSSEELGRLFDPDGQSDAEEGKRIEDVDEVIQSLAGMGEALAEEWRRDSDDPPKMTAKMAAERRIVELQAKTPKDLALDESSANLNRALLVFPSDPPSVHSVLQASVESEMDPTATKSQPEPEKLLVEAQADSSFVLDPDSDSVDDKKNETAPSKPSFSATEKEVPGVIADCEQAITSINRLVLMQQNEESSVGELLRAKLLAYQDLSRIGGLLIASESPSVTRVFTELTQSNVLSQLEPLCGEWIGWQGRQTEGILLIGRLQDKGAVMEFELSDGTRMNVEFPSDREFPIGRRCAILGKIISTDEAPLIRLVAGVVVP